MPATPPPPTTAHRPRSVTLPAEQLSRLFDALHADGRTVVGPTPRDGAVVMAPIRSPDELPRGLTDAQAPGRYELVPHAEDGAFFGVTLGPQSMKRWLHPPSLTLFRTRRRGQGFEVQPPTAPGPVAVIGARACDLAAVATQDEVFLGASHVDPHYASRRRDLLVIAVQCGRAASTCFCPSMGTGPRVRSGYDVLLTEIIDESGHRFLAESGSVAGATLLDTVGLAAAPSGDLDAADAAAATAQAEITRRLPTEGLRERLLEALQSPAWDDVAQRCLACANCTMVCPTCFCTTVDDVTDLDGVHSRVRRWDSCFHTDFSYVHGGGPVRASTRARYRQWLTHKLATWHDQFGRSGCVGCGRCVTWCPAGIDIVAEACRIAGDDSAPAPSPTESP